MFLLVPRFAAITIVNNKGHQMTVCYSHKKKDPFVRFDKNIVYDSRLTWKAKGLLTYAFSRPDDWKFYKKEMMTHGADGETSFDSGIKELEAVGYLHRIKVKEVSTGQFRGWEWHFFEDPINEEEFKKLYRQGGFPDIGVSPTSGKPSPTKKDLSSKKDKKEEERDSSSPFPLKEKSDLRTRFENPNFKSIQMTDQERKTLCERGHDLTDQEWDDICLRFIQRSKLIEIKPVGGYFTTLIKEKAKPLEDPKKAAQKRARDEEAISDERKMIIRILKNKFENNRYWSMELGNFVTFRDEPNNSFTYKFAVMNNSINVPYLGDEFPKELEKLNKKLQELKPQR